MILGAEVPHPLPAGGAGSELLAKTVRPFTELAVRFVCAAAAAGCAAPCVGGGRDAIAASQAEPVDATLRYKVPGDPSRGRAYSPRMEHAIDYKSVLDCGIHQDWTSDS